MAKTHSNNLGKVQSLFHFLSGASRKLVYNETMQYTLCQILS